MLHITSETHALDLAAQFPVYRCHKIVRALHIAQVSVNSKGSTVLAFHDQEENLEVVPSRMQSKPVPQPGWYIVFYDNGYFSFSPEECFNDGYTLSTEPV